MINKIIDFCTNFFEMIIDVFKWVLEHILYILSEVGYIVLDFGLTITEEIVTHLDLDFITSSFGNWDILPEQILYILNKLDVLFLLGMLSSVCLLRVVVNLIPAAVTRV